MWDSALLFRCHAGPVHPWADARLVDRHGQRSESQGQRMGKWQARPSMIHGHPRGTRAPPPGRRGMGSRNVGSPNGFISLGRLSVALAVCRRCGHDRSGASAEQSRTEADRLRGAQPSIQSGAPRSCSRARKQARCSRDDMIPVALGLSTSEGVEARDPGSNETLPP